MIEFLVGVAMKSLEVQDGKTCHPLNIKHLIFFSLIIFVFCQFVIFEDVFVDLFHWLFVLNL